MKMNYARQFLRINFEVILFNIFPSLCIVLWSLVNITVQIQFLCWGSLAGVDIPHVQVGVESRLWLLK